MPSRKMTCFRWPTPGAPRCAALGILDHTLAWPRQAQPLACTGPHTRHPHRTAPLSVDADREPWEWHGLQDAPGDPAEIPSLARLQRPKAISATFPRLLSYPSVAAKSRHPPGKACPHRSHYTMNTLGLQPSVLELLGSGQFCDVRIGVRALAGRLGRQVEYDQKRCWAHHQPGTEMSQLRFFISLETTGPILTAIGGPHTRQCPWSTLSPRNAAARHHAPLPAHPSQACHGPVLKGRP